MPVNRKHPLADLMAACRRYLKVAPRDFITFEYVMLGGINDRLEQADELVELVRRENVPCKFNLIPFNPFTQSDLRKPEREQVLGHRDDGPQDARGRHRRCVRPARGRGARPHPPRRAPCTAEGRGRASSAGGPPQGVASRRGVRES